MPHTDCFTAVEWTAAFMEELQKEFYPLGANVRGVERISKQAVVRAAYRTLAQLTNKDMLPKPLLTNPSE